MFFTCVVYIAGLLAYFEESAIVILAILVAGFVVAIVKNYISPKIILLWLFMFFFAYFNADLRINDSDYLYKVAPKDVVIKGQIVSIPDTGFENKTRFFFNVSDIFYDDELHSVSAKTYVRIDCTKEQMKNFKIGDFYKINGKLRAPFKVTNPSQFDYGKYLRNFNAFSLFYSTYDNCYRVEEKIGAKWGVVQHLNNLRTKIITTHSKYLKSPNLEILGGIVFGDDAISPPDHIKDAFTNSGLLHILAASGMNVALIYGIWFFLLNKFRVPYKVIVASGIFIVSFYTLMTGMGASVLRAATILIFVLIGKLINRDVHSISLLSFVALIMLIINPSYINDVSFQLSFIVTFGLLVMMPFITEKLKPYIPPYFTGILFVPLVAQIWVTPIQMYYFNSFSLYSFFANVFAMPFLTVISFGGFISSVLSIITPISDIVCRVFDFVLNPFLNILVWISTFFASLPESLMTMPKPSAVQILLYYSLVILLIFIIKHGFSRKTVTSLFIISFSLFMLSVNYSNKMEIITFDVQNADAILLKTPDNKYFIIDSGKMPYNSGKSQAKYVINKYLKDRGVKNIDGMILTHFDADHAGGAEDLISSLNIKHVYVNSLNDKSPIAQNLYAKYPEKLRLVHNGQTIYKQDNAKVQLFEAGFSGKKSSSNENSIMTLASEGEHDTLLMGDAGVEAFEKVQAKLPKKVEVLKVGHHGAKNVVNKKMLDRLNPDYAIISTGKNNYGHPNGVVLDTLKSNNVKVLRTDRNNAIKLDSTRVQSFSKEKGWVDIK